MKDSKMTRTVRVVNRHHIKVKKCCASCQFKDIDQEGNRICTSMELKVESSFRCPLWQMSEGMQNAGMAHGTVRMLTDVVIY